jgi:hypothetical protein
MADQWILNLRSFWVIADKEGITDYGDRKELSDPDAALTNEAAGVLALFSFSTPDGAAAYILENDLQDWEPVTFDSFVKATGFLQCMAQRNVKRILLDPIPGYLHVRFVDLEQTLRKAIAELDRHDPDAGDPGPRNDD